MVGLAERTSTGKTKWSSFGRSSISSSINVSLVIREHRCNKLIGYLDRSALLETIVMSIVRWLCLFSLALSCALSHPALSAELSVPVKADRPAQAARPSGRLCTDMNGKTFRWNWPNVPFAAVCNDDDGRVAKPSGGPHLRPQ